VKLIITHALLEAGSNFHKQKLYHVPRETAQQIAGDFEAYEKETYEKKESPENNASEPPACKTYKYALDVPRDDDTARPDEIDDTTADNEKSDSVAEPQGFLSVDFRTVVAVQGYDRLS
jgi:hypothetical protein